MSFNNRLLLQIVLIQRLAGELFYHFAENVNGSRLENERAWTNTDQLSGAIFVINGCSIIFNFGWADLSFILGENDDQFKWPHISSFLSVCFQDNFWVFFFSFYFSQIFFLLSFYFHHCVAVSVCSNIKSNMSWVCSYLTTRVYRIQLMHNSEGIIPCT